MTKNIILKNFAVSGFRSFGPKLQKFQNFSKINIFIGQNNSGKSNIIKIISDIIPKFIEKTIKGNAAFKVDYLDRNQIEPSNIRIGFANNLIKDRNTIYIDGEDFLNKPVQPNTVMALNTIFQNIKGNKCWYIFDAQGGEDESDISKYLSDLPDHQIVSLWNYLTNQSGGSRKKHWEPETARHFRPSVNSYKATVVPAIRQISASSDKPYGFDGVGIIKELAELQNPEIDKREDFEKFERINRFLQLVTENDSATIEIPHKRETILVHMDKKILPIESLGTGIHEVIILAATATIIENSVICIEEPELHLNPILQKRLLNYLESETSNQYFITTHSPSIMDTEGAEIYHVRLDDGATQVKRCTTSDTKRSVCHDLGYHPSDLLQANCIIWVEGPSDRIYLNHWLHNASDDLVEGIHYSIMFYGGRLASHPSANDIDDFVEDFISLKRLNRNLAILIDSDKDKPHARINKTKNRLRQEFESNNGLCWITAGREIENYITASEISDAIAATKPSAVMLNANYGKFENPLKIRTKGGKETQASKTDVARHVAQNFPANLQIHDLSKKIQELVEFIKSANSLN